jgi:hypothetical protein
MVNRKRIGRKCAAAVAAFALGVSRVRGDMSALGVTGPHSGAGFSNLGAVSKDAVATTLTSANVLIEIQGRKGDDLTATCTAAFDLDTDKSLAKQGQTVLVAFPVTGFGGEAVKITQFEIVIDGIREAEPEERRIRLYSGDAGGTAYIDVVHRDWPKVEANPDDFGYFGFKLHGENAGSTETLLQAYAWTQEFLPGKHCRVEVKYLMTLHAQSLEYAKKFLHEQSPNVVPFDDMWAGSSEQKAFFMDYILRSGATWKGPIGNETVTLRTAKSSGIKFQADELITFGRHIFAHSRDDAGESVSRYRAGLDAEGIKRSDGVVWVIDHEKPRQDILLEIPEMAVREKGAVAVSSP